MRRRQHTNDSMVTLPINIPAPSSSLAFPSSGSPLSATPPSSFPLNTQQQQQTQQQQSKRSILTRPSRWFTRNAASSLASSASASLLPSASSPSRPTPAPSPPRSSFSFTLRRPTVSQSSSLGAPSLPTAARSLLDVSTLPPIPPSPERDPPSPPLPATPTSPTMPPPPGTGELRGLASKPWSRSMDDLSKFLGNSRTRKASEKSTRKGGAGPASPVEERERADAWPLAGSSPGKTLHISGSVPHVHEPHTPPAVIPTGDAPRLPTPQPISPFSASGSLLTPGTSPTPVGPSPTGKPESPTAGRRSPLRSRSDKAEYAFPSSSSGVAGQDQPTLPVPRLRDKGRSVSESRVSTVRSLTSASSSNSGGGGHSRTGSRGGPAFPIPPVPPVPSFPSVATSASNSASGGLRDFFTRSTSPAQPSVLASSSSIPAPPAPVQTSRSHPAIVVQRETARHVAHTPVPGPGRSPLKAHAHAIPPPLPVSASAPTPMPAPKSEDPARLPPFLSLLTPLSSDAALALYASGKLRGAGAGGAGAEFEGGAGESWRACKAVLKGSKVLFYKVPADRARLVESHFPQHLLPISEPSSSTPQDPFSPPSTSGTSPYAYAHTGLYAAPTTSSSASPNASVVKLGRRRVYWGRGRHPDWVLRDGEGGWEGTGEAVAHECVFGTLFVREDEEDVLSEEAVRTEPEEKPATESEMATGGVKEEATEMELADEEAPVVDVKPAAEGDAGEASKEGEDEPSQSEAEPDEPTESASPIVEVSVDKGDSKAEPATNDVDSAELAHVDEEAPPAYEANALSDAPVPVEVSETAKAEVATDAEVESPPEVETVAEVELTPESNLVDADTTTAPADPAAPAAAPVSDMDTADPRHLTFIRAAIAVMPVVWGKEFWTEIERCIFILEEGEERERVVRRLRKAMLEVWGRNMCDALVEKEEAVSGLEKEKETELPVSDAMERRLRGGLDMHTFFQLPPALVAHSLRVFHGKRFARPFTPSSILHPRTDLSLWTYSASPSSSSPEDDMHPLTRLVLLHVLVQARGLEERRRAIRRWVEVLRDGCGYGAGEAVRRALGCVAVARLEGIADLVVGVEMLEEKGVWKGGRESVKGMLDGIGREGRWGVGEMEGAWEVVRRKWEGWVREEEGEIEEEEKTEVGALVKFWEKLTGQREGTYQTLSSFLAPSLAIQPKRPILMAEHFWLPRPADRTPASLLAPVHFPEGSFPSLVPDRHDTDKDIIRLMDGELVVRILPRDAGSPPVTRPPSLALPASFSVPAPSSTSPPTTAAKEHRMSIVSTLSRSTTISRRSSMPPRAEVAQPQRAIVLGGTLDRLIDLLVLGQDVEVDLPAVRDDLAMGKREKVLLEVEEMKKIWWTWGKTWVGGVVLFELLRKRFNNPAPSPAFNFTKAALADRVKLGVLSALESWILQGGAAQEARDDPALMQTLSDFLKPDPEDTDEVAQRRRVVSTMWEKHIRTPPKASERPGRAVRKGEGAFESTAPSITTLDAERLVDRLDDTAAALLDDITRQDLLTTADILEVQLTDRVGFFQTQDTLFSVSDDAPIQNIYSLLTHTDASVLFSPSSAPPIVQLLPDNVKLAIRGHQVMQRWIVSKVTEGGLGVVARQQRIELLLRAIEVCRHRAGDTAPRKRSFVETAIVAALLLPESRAFARAWQGVALARGASLDTLSGLMFTGNNAAVRRPSQPITVDLGWGLERMLELLSMPNVSGAVQDSHSLVNLHKRRMVDALISDIFTSIPPLRGNNHVLVNDLHRLRNMEAESEGWPPSDGRQMREDLWREQQYALPLTKAQTRMRPFSRSIAMQLEKFKRDKATKDRATRELRAEKEKSEKRDGDLTRMMTQPKRPQKGQHKGRRSVTAFFRVVRPLSTAFGSDRQFDSDSHKTLQELDFVVSSSPTLSLSLVHARVRPRPNEHRSFMFEVQTEEGGRYVLQAASARDKEDWIAAISKASEAAAARRSTMEAASPKLDMHAMVDSKVRPPSLHPKSVYGIRLTVLLVREYGGDLSDAEKGLPPAIERLIEEVEIRGLTETGIYRISGSSSTINALRDSLDKGIFIDLGSDEYADIYAICDAIKMWFRMLPEPVLPSNLYWDFINAAKIEDYDTRLYRIQDLVLSLSRPNFLCLRRLMEHLNRVTDYEDQNQMHAHSLAIIFGPNLLKPPPSPASYALAMGNLGFAANLIKIMILQYHWLFNEPDEAEADPIADADLETPIVEERRFSMTVLEDAVVIEDHPIKQNDSTMTMPDIDVIAPTPESSVDDHHLDSEEEDIIPAASSTSTP